MSQEVTFLLHNLDLTAFSKLRGRGFDGCSHAGGLQVQSRRPAGQLSAGQSLPSKSSPETFHIKRRPLTQRGQAAQALLATVSSSLFYEVRHVHLYVCGTCVNHAVLLEQNHPDAILITGRSAMSYVTTV